jgi:hypothetical protein
MLDDGWVRDLELLGEAADFCRGCAHMLRIARIAEHCSWCGDLLEGEDAAEAVGWVYFADEFGSLHACCPRCLAERFGIAARAKRRYRAQ